MKPSLKYGIILGVLCGAWTYIMGILGWYKDPALLNLFWVVVIIQFIVLFLGLKITGTQNTYGQQVGTGTLMSFIGSVIIFISSLLFTTLFFPNYFVELEELNRQILTESGKSVDEVEMLVNQMSAMQTPFFQALFGMIGTIVTGLIISLILGVVFKKKN